MSYVTVITANEEVVKSITDAVRYIMDHPSASNQTKVEALKVMRTTFKPCPVKIENVNIDTTPTPSSFTYPKPRLGSGAMRTVAGGGVHSGTPIENEEFNDLLKRIHEESHTQEITWTSPVYDTVSTNPAVGTTFLTKE